MARGHFPLYRKCQVPVTWADVAGVCIKFAEPLNPYTLKMDMLKSLGFTEDYHLAI